MAVYAAATLSAMAPMSIAAAIAIACCLWARHRLAAPRSSELRAYVLWSLALAGAWILSLIGLALTPYVVPGFEPPAVRWGADLLKLWYFAWTPLLAAALGGLDTRSEQTVWRVWIVTFAVLSVVGILQFYTGWPRKQGIPDLPDRFHATLFLGHHLSVASIWIFPFFASLAAFFSAPIRLHWGIPRWLAGACALLGFGVLMLTFSRMLWLGLPVGLLLFGVLRVIGSHRAASGKFISMRLGLLAAACVLGVALAWQVPSIQIRMRYAVGSNERIQLWKANWEFFRARPLTGVGRHHNLELAGQYLRSRQPEGSIFIGHAHNNAIDVMGSMGFPGLIAWLGFNAWILAALLRMGFSSGQPSWISDLCIGLLAAFVVFHLNGLTNLNFWEGKVQHQLAWMVAWVLAWSGRARAQAVAAAVK